MRAVRIIVESHLNTIEQTHGQILKRVDNTILFVDHDAGGPPTSRQWIVLVVDELGPNERGRLSIGQETRHDAQLLFGHRKRQIELFGELEHPVVQRRVVVRPDCGQVGVLETTLFDACLFDRDDFREGVDYPLNPSTKE